MSCCGATKVFMCCSKASQISTADNLTTAFPRQPLNQSTAYSGWYRSIATHVNGIGFDERVKSELVLCVTFAQRPLPPSNLRGPT